MNPPSPARPPLPVARASEELAARSIRWVIVCLLLTSLVLTQAQSWAAANPVAGPPAGLLNDAKAGEALAADLRNARPSTNAEFRGELKIRRKGGSTEVVPVVSRIRAGFASWESTYVAARSNRTEILMVAHLPGQTNSYRYACLEGASLPSTDPPACSQIWQPFAGSDFFLADLGLEFFHWPGQVLIQNEMRKNRACHVLESRPALTNAYARVRSWIDVETGGLLMAEAYDEQDRRVKEFEVRSFKKSGDQWQLQEMEIRNLKSRSRTTLEFEVPEK
jgi:hypothetical protein